MMTQNRLKNGTRPETSPLGACLGLFMFFASTIALVGASVPPVLPLTDEASVVESVSAYSLHGLPDW